MSEKRAAKNVTVDYPRGTVSIDGEDFPFSIGGNPEVTVGDPVRGVPHSVTISILAESVELLRVPMRGNEI